MNRPTPHAAILRVGDEIRWNGDAFTVATLTAQQVRLVDAAGEPTLARLPELLADQALEVLSSTPNAPMRSLDGLPAGVVEAARWWERHIVEVLTGLPLDPAPGQQPKPEYDAGLRSLRQRELAKVEELRRAGHRIGWSTLKRRRLDYERDGIWAWSISARPGTGHRPAASTRGWSTRLPTPSPRRPAVPPARSLGCGGAQNSCWPPSTGPEWSPCPRSARSIGWSHDCHRASTPSDRHEPGGRWPNNPKAPSRHWSPPGPGS
ncbi:Uncharacterised protein [Nocardia africana]|uniref:Uncharacterized protein n=1 Tax=Nocardia africana TaxID=134964 RepID=A0A378X157_9NOCA|nr:Uncharacterised protein [Nocardia africana]